MYGLLGSDKIWPRYNYLKFWNLRVQKIKIFNLNFLAMHITNQKLSFDIFYGRKCTKYFHGTLSLLNIFILFGIKEKSIILTHTKYFLAIAKYTCVTYDRFCDPGSHI